MPKTSELSESNRLWAGGRMRIINLFIVWVLTLLPALAQVEGTYWDVEGTARNAEFLKQDMLLDCNQQFYTLQGTKMTRFTAGMASAYTVGGDTFVSRTIEGQPLFLKKLRGGALSLYSADESILHQTLIERTGTSPLDPFTTNRQRSSRDTSYDVPIGVLMWEDGEYAILNPNKKTEALGELKRFLTGYPDPLPTLPNNQRTVTFTYLADVVGKYNAWMTKKTASEGDKSGF